MLADNDIQYELRTIFENTAASGNPDASVSMKEFRAKEAQFSGASIVCTACPFCGKNIRKGMTGMGIKNIKTFDIAGLAAGLL